MFWRVRRQRRRSTSLRQRHSHALCSLSCIGVSAGVSHGSSPCTRHTPRLLGRQGGGTRRMDLNAHRSDARNLGRSCVSLRARSDPKSDPTPARKERRMTQRAPSCQVQSPSCTRTGRLWSPANQEEWRRMQRACPREGSCCCARGPVRCERRPYKRGRSRGASSGRGERAHRALEQVTACSTELRAPRRAAFELGVMRRFGIGYPPHHFLMPLDSR